MTSNTTRISVTAWYDQRTGHYWTSIGDDHPPTDHGIEERGTVNDLMRASLSASLTATRLLLTNDQDGAWDSTLRSMELRTAAQLISRRQAEARRKA